MADWPTVLVAGVVGAAGGIGGAWVTGWTQHRTKRLELAHDTTERQRDRAAQSRREQRERVRELMRPVSRALANVDRVASRTFALDPPGDMTPLREAAVRAEAEVETVRADLLIEDGFHATVGMFDEVVRLLHFYAMDLRSADDQSGSAGYPGAAQAYRQSRESLIEAIDAFWAELRRRLASLGESPPADPV